MIEIEAPPVESHLPVEGEARRYTGLTVEALFQILKIPAGHRISHVEWDGSCQVLRVYYERSCLAVPYSPMEGYTIGFDLGPDSGMDFPRRFENETT